MNLRISHAIARICLGLAVFPVASTTANALTLEERADCLASVEQVYWQHRTWPSENPGPKPGFKSVTSQSQFVSEARDSLAMSAALEALWGETVDANALQREVERMARETRDPEILGQIFQALDRDPGLVRECLARPRLAERRLRARYGAEERSERPFRAWWSEQRERFATAAQASDGPGGAVIETSLPNLPDGAGPQSPDSWMATPALPRSGRDVKAIWTGSEFIVWGGAATFHRGGRYDPALDLWTPLSVVGEPGIRRDHTMVWTGQKVIVWGGWGFLETSNVLGDGAAYDPTTDTWTPLSDTNAPSPRSLHTAVWTGDEMVVWGGCPHFQCFSTTGDGARYDPDTDTWSPVSGVDAPTARGQHTAVWTGAEMLVWGGNLGGPTVDPVGAGHGYDPLSDTWRALSATGAPADRLRHTAVWADGEMIAWGGRGDAGLLDSGGRYDPVADTWTLTDTIGAPDQRVRHIAVWTGDVMIVWGGCRDSECSQHVGGSRYDPVTDTWDPVAAAGSPGVRSQPGAVWSGTEMIIYGGCSSGECQVSRNDGGRYDPVTNSWVVMDLPDTPTARINHTAVWTGAEMIVWGGLDEQTGLVLTGGRYDPATNTWTPTAIDGEAAARDSHTAVWTGSEMIIWSGRVAGLGTSPIGARYDPTTDTWTGMTTTSAPDGRSLHTAVWTGSEMVVWGGCRFSDCQSYFNNGGSYDPAADTWSSISNTGAPPQRFNHTAVIADGDMIVWGGLDGSGVLADGGRYDPALDQWSPVSATMEPTARSGHAAVTTGSEMIVWGGTDGVSPLADGGRYDPATDSWATVSGAGAPAARNGHVAVWDGQAMLIWGGCDGPACSQSGGGTFFAEGGRYRPDGDAWSPTTTSFAPLGRNGATAVWTGERMIVWGGWRGMTADITRTGGVYRPAGGDLMFSHGFENGDG